MIVRFAKVAILAAIVTAVVQSLPDIKRYIEMRQM